MIDEATLNANRSIGRRVLLEIWSEGELDLADELYAPGYVDHTPRGPESENVQGPDGIKQAVKLFRTAFPDLQYTIEEEMAERDLVLTRFSARGTHRGAFLGTEPTGRAVSYTGMDLNRIVDGRIVESWIQYDALSLLEQLELVPRGRRWGADGERSTMRYMLLMNYGDTPGVPPMAEWEPEDARAARR